MNWSCWNWARTRRLMWIEVHPQFEFMATRSSKCDHKSLRATESARTACELQLCVRFPFMRISQRQFLENNNILCERSHQFDMLGCTVLSSEYNNYCCWVAAGDNRKYVNESWKFINARLSFFVCAEFLAAVIDETCTMHQLLLFAWRLSSLFSHFSNSSEISQCEFDLWLANFSAELSAHLIIADIVYLSVNFKDNGPTVYHNESPIFTQILIHLRRARRFQLIFNLQTDRTRGSVSRASVKW